MDTHVLKVVVHRIQVYCCLKQIAHEAIVDSFTILLEVTMLQRKDITSNICCTAVGAPAGRSRSMALETTADFYAKKNALDVTM